MSRFTMRSRACVLTVANDAASPRLDPSFLNEEPTATQRDELWKKIEAEVARAAESAAGLSRAK